MKSESIPSLQQLTVYWLPLFLYSSLIIFLSSLSHPEEHFSDPYFIGFGNDKVAHGIEYGILGILFFRAFQWGLGRTYLPTPALWAIISTILFGISDEIHQYFVPNRDADPWDILADFTGATFGIMSWTFFQGIRKRIQVR